MNKILIIVIIFLFCITQTVHGHNSQKATLSAMAINETQIRVVVVTTQPTALFRGEEKIAFLTPGESRLIVSNLFPGKAYTFSLRKRGCSTLLSSVMCRTLPVTFIEETREIAEKKEEFSTTTEEAENSKEKKTSEIIEKQKKGEEDSKEEKGALTLTVTQEVLFAKEVIEEDYEINETRREETKTEKEIGTEIKEEVLSSIVVEDQIILAENYFVPVVKKQVKKDSKDEEKNSDEEVFVVIEESVMEKTSSSSKMGIFPVLSNSAYYSSYYGMRPDPFTGEDSFHYGVDISASYNTPVAATHSGEVVFTGWRGEFGKKVKVLSVIAGQNIYIVYAHLNTITVEVGDNVSVGQIIGGVGSTGRSTGSHLHYEIRNSDGNPINPLREGFLPKR